MSISITQLSNQGLNYEFYLNIAWDLIDQKIDKRANKDQENFSLNGFRKGQVPINIIREKNLTLYLRSEIEKLVDKTIDKILDDNKIQPSSYPKTYIEKANPNENAEIKIIIEAMPTVPEIDLTKINITEYELVLQDSLVETFVTRNLKSLLTQNKQPQNYQAKIGDIVVIDYIGFIEEKQFEDGLYKNQKIELGSKTLVANFEEQIVGAKEGDTLKVQVTFPADYFKPIYANKNGVFEVTVKEIYSYETQELNDVFIKEKLGFETRQQLFDNTKQQMKKGYKLTLQNIVKKELFDQLDAQYKIDLPQSLLENQIKVVANQQGIEKFSQEQKNKLAERMVRCGIIINDIANKNSIKVEKNEFDAKINDILSFIPNEEESKTFLEELKENDEMVNQIVGSIIEEKVLDFISKSAIITAKTIQDKEVDQIWYNINNTLIF
jgi:trigger factor